MASIDKAAIGFSIAIVAVGVAFAFYQSGVQDATPIVSSPAASAPMVQKNIEPKTQADPFADIANKVKEEAAKKPMEEMKQETVQKPAMKQEQKQEMKHVGPQTIVVEIPAGTSTPGCEETNKCFTPSSVTINVGDTVEWHNTDTAAHTVTSGSPADGPSGVFDSSLFMGGATFDVTFEEAGSYDYFCMVHPWMVGSIQVN